MVAIGGSSSWQGRSSLDWRAAFVDALVHATVVFWLLTSGWSRPDLPISASMVLVSLWEPPLTRTLPERPAATTTAAAQRTAVPSKNAATATRQAVRRQPGRTVVAPTAERPVDVERESSETDAAAAASLASNGTQASLALRGDGAYTGPRFRQPRVMRRVTPNYPPAALRARQQGSVDVIVTIAADGRPVEAHVHRSSGAPALDEASVTAALAYTYRPGERNGVPTESQGLVTIDWKIGAKTTEHVDAGPLSSSREAEQKRLDCLGNDSHSVELRRSASLCGPVKRR